MSKPKIITITERYCQRCKNRWFPQSTRRPKVCPRCKSYKYDEPKKERAA